MWSTQGIYDFPTDCLPLHMFVMYLFFLTPSVSVSVFSYHYLLLSFQQHVMIQKPRPESEEEQHTVASQATGRRAIAFTCRGCNRHQHSLTIIPLPETAWHNLVLISITVCEYPCWMKQGVGFCEYSLVVSSQFCLQAYKPCSPLKSVTWLCMTVISGWNRNLSVSICFEGAKYN